MAEVGEVKVGLLVLARPEEGEAVQAAVDDSVAKPERPAEAAEEEKRVALLSSGRLRSQSSDRCL